MSRNVKCHEILNVMKCQMSLNFKSHEMSKVKCHEMTNVMKCQESWNVKCHEMLMLMLDLWPQADTPGVTHFGAYHRPPDCHFYFFFPFIFFAPSLMSILILVVVVGVGVAPAFSGISNRDGRGRDYPIFFIPGWDPVIFRDKTSLIFLSRDFFGKKWSKTNLGLWNHGFVWYDKSHKIPGFYFFQNPGIGIWVQSRAYLIFVIFSPQALFLAKFFSTQKRVNRKKRFCDKTT